MPSPVMGSTTFAASPAKSAWCVRETVDVERRRDRPRAMCAVGLGVRAEDVAHHRTIEHVPPQRGEALAARHVVIGITQHAEAHVGATVTHGEHPGVAGEELGVEDHPEPRVVHPAEVLTERVPRAELGCRRVTRRGVVRCARRAGRGEQASHRGVVAVGRDHPAGGHRGSVVEFEIAPFVVGGGPGDSRTLTHVDPESAARA